MSQQRETEYSWYDLVRGEELRQGDLLFNCPVLAPRPDLTFPLSAEVPSVLSEFDVIVMTQSCDLELPKVPDVILCPHWDLREAVAIEPSLGNRKVWDEIRKGRQHRYCLLASCERGEHSMGVRIVDFGRIFSLPKQFVRQVAAQHSSRLRLRPPYREHIAQAFARFFMRVGLPQELELPE